MWSRNCKSENAVTKARAARGIRSRNELGMVCCDPLLDKFEECLGLSNNLFRFGLCSYERMVVINDISFPSAGFKEIERSDGRRAKYKARRVECQTVMPWCVRKAISSACDRHLGCLKSCIIRGRESAVFRQSLDRCI